MSISLPLFSQRDNRWKDKKLGTSSSTLGGYGCLVTCLAMVSKYYGKDTDPDRLNSALVNVGGFKDKNLYIWESLTKVYGDIHEVKRVETPKPVSSDQFTSWENELKGGRPIILHVDFTPSTPYDRSDMHFVVLIGKEGDKWVVADPWYGDISSLDRYGEPRVTVQKFIFTSGPIQVTPIDNSNGEHKLLLELITAGFTALPQDDPAREKMESYVRAMIDEHKSAKTNAEKAKQLDGFISKWLQEWGLKTDDTIVEIEAEMAKFLTFEDLKDKYREAIEKVLNKTYELDDAMFKALEALETEFEGLKGTAETLQKKLDKLTQGKVVRTVTLGKYIIRIAKT